MSAAALTLVWSALPMGSQPLLSFLRRGAGQARFYWQDGAGGVSLAAFGIAGRLQSAGERRFEEIRAQAETFFRGMRGRAEGDAPPWVHPYLVGGFAFSPAHEAAGIWEGYPAAWFVLPRYTLLRKEGQTWLLAALLMKTPDPAAARDLLWHLPAPAAPAARAPLLPAAEDFPPRPRWEAAVAETVRRIRAGDFHKVVLSRLRRLRTRAPVDPLLALDRLQTRYPRCYRFLCEPQPGAAFFGATPELLAGTRAGLVRTMALAGSARRGATQAEDEALGEGLLHSAKNRNEHALVVEAIRRSLAPLVTELHAPESPQLKRLSNIQHLHTPIRGRLRPGVSPLEVVAALHPTPAVGGLPRQAALAYLQQTEARPRGWYAAPVGWLGPQGAAEFAVALRCALSRGRETYLFAGAGIVADSDPAAEWRETALKLRPVQQALA